LWSKQAFANTRNLQRRLLQLDQESLRGAAGDEVVDLAQRIFLCIPLSVAAQENARDLRESGVSE
jgi:hypothetical protein